MSDGYEVYRSGEGSRPEESGEAGADGAAEDLPWELGGPGGPDATHGRLGLAGVTEADPEGGWCVLVEFAAQRDVRPATVVRVLDDDLATEQEAREAARARAFDFDPPDPRMPQVREVYEDGDAFTVIIKGAASTFHLSVRVARFAGVRV